MSEFKLTIEIGKPAYAQMKTVRDSISRALWNSVRKRVQETSDYTCQICGAYSEDKLHAHEVWEYDEDEYLLILREIQALCKSCHDLKHLHHAALRINDRKIRAFVMKKLKKHFMKVNDCTEKDFERHYRNQLAKSENSFVNRSSEDLLLERDLREREQFLNAQRWQFVIVENIPFSQEIKSQLLLKGLLYERNRES